MLDVKCTLLLTQTEDIVMEMNIYIQIQNIFLNESFLQESLLIYNSGNFYFLHKTQRERYMYDVLALYTKRCFYPVLDVLSM